MVEHDFSVLMCRERVAGGKDLSGWIAVSLLGALMIGGCGAGKDDKAGKKPPQVGYVIVNPVEVDLTTELAGRVAAMESSEVRPQVSGLIRRRLFVEGGLVQRGQTLYEIDPRVYGAAVDEARANLHSAQANAGAAKALADRYKPLADAQAVARQDYTNARAQADQAGAQVEQMAARLRTAQVNLQFTRVPSPISGRIGRSLSTQGALVTAGQAQPLAVIQRMDPVYVDVQQSSADLLALRRSLATDGMRAGSATAHLTLEDGSTYGRAGIVKFSEVVVNPATGTITLRAQFPNPDGVLLPGMFVREVFTKAVNASAYRVPQQAVRRDAKGNASVFVVGKDNKAVRREIVARDAQDNVWIVTDGLTPGDKVITQGLDNVKADKPVKPVPAETPQNVKPKKSGAAKPSGADA